MAFIPIVIGVLLLVFPRLMLRLLSTEARKTAIGGIDPDELACLKEKLDNRVPLSSAEKRQMRRFLPYYDRWFVLVVRLSGVAFFSIGLGLQLND